MYKLNIVRNTNLSLGEFVRGERIETKVTRMMSNKEPISDGAPLLYDDDESDQMVKAGYDIRTDRFDIALMGRNAIERSKLAKKEGVHATNNNDTPENNATADDAA